jgi:hypothetical protein
MMHQRWNRSSIRRGPGVLACTLWIAAGCHGIYTHPGLGDAATQDATSGDAMEPPLSDMDKQGGEIRLEWIQNAAGQNTARATAFFYATEQPDWHSLPAFPGCVDARSADFWPFAAGLVTYRDVGGVVVHTPTGSDLSLTKTMGGVDPLGRGHALWWSKPADFAANDGTRYLPPDSPIDVLLTGWAEWPAQTYLGFGYMPAAFTPLSPPAQGNVVLPAGTLTITSMPGINTHLSDQYVDSAVIFTGPTDPDGAERAVIVCEYSGEPASIAVPAALVTIIRSYGSGHLIRQVFGHSIMELTDGSPRATMDRKRVDVLGIWSYDTTWSAN